MPVDIQQRPVREPSEISARRPIFRILCDSTNPTFAKSPARIATARGIEAVVHPCSPCHAERSGIVPKDNLTQPKHPYPRPRGVGDFSFS